ncbi:MAG: hypothetical protein ABGZ17_12860, partial [Planctomycetaceae bacterium]
MFIARIMHRACRGKRNRQRMAARRAAVVAAELEMLENRILLSAVTLQETSDAYHVQFDTTQEILVQEFTNENNQLQLQYQLGQLDSGSFSSDFDSSQAGTQSILLSGLTRDLVIDNLDNGTILNLGSVHTFGNELEVSADGDIVVQDGAVISTRLLASAGLDENAPSAGNSGSLTLETETSISVYGDIYTHVDEQSPYTPGSITLEVSDVKNVTDGGQDELSITLQGSSIKGGEVEITAENKFRKFAKQVVGVDTNTVDVSLLNTTIEAESISVEATADDIIGFYGGQYKWFGTMIAGGFFEGGLGTLFESGPLEKFSVAQWPTVSVFIRDAMATLSIDGSDLSASGAITLKSDAAAESEAEVVQTKPYGQKQQISGGFGGQGGVEIGVGYARATGAAETTIAGETTITAGGDVTISATGSAKALANVRTMSMPPFTPTAAGSGVPTVPLPGPTAANVKMFAVA